MDEGASPASPSRPLDAEGMRDLVLAWLKRRRERLHAEACYAAMDGRKDDELKAILRSEECGGILYGLAEVMG